MENWEASNNIEFQFWIHSRIGSMPFLEIQQYIWIYMYTYIYKIAIRKSSIGKKQLQMEKTYFNCMTRRKKTNSNSLFLYIIGSTSDVVVFR